LELWYLRPGHKIRTRDGAEAEVLSETEAGHEEQQRDEGDPDRLYRRAGEGLPPGRLGIPEAVRQPR
jgi:hypothetical protein